MKNGWIKISDELPPLNEFVIVGYPNVAYNSHFMAIIGKRIDDLTIVSKDCPLTLSVNQDAFCHATHWAYNNGQKLKSLCEKYCCNIEL
jgi:hypothetical protein